MGADPFEELVGSVGCANFGDGFGPFQGGTLARSVEGSLTPGRERVKTLLGFYQRRGRPWYAAESMQ